MADSMAPQIDAPLPPENSATIESSVSNTSKERILITNSRGENLVGILHEAGSENIVILCHGFRSSKESRTLSAVADALTSAKITTFRFDFAGNGESEGTFQYGNYLGEADDLRSVIVYFQKQSRPVTSIIGHSKGGNVVILYASKYRDVSTVINISGRFDLKQGIKERLGKDYLERIEREGFIDVKNKAGETIYRVTGKSLTDRINTDMQSACAAIDRSTRVLTIHGSEDKIVHPENAVEFSRSVGNHKLHVIEGADHGFTSHLLELGEVVVQFVLDH